MANWWEREPEESTETQGVGRPWWEAMQEYRQGQQQAAPVAAGWHPPMAAGAQGVSAWYPPMAVPAQAPAVQVGAQGVGRPWWEAMQEYRQGGGGGAPIGEAAPVEETGWQAPYLPLVGGPGQGRGRSSLEELFVPEVVRRVEEYGQARQVGLEPPEGSRLPGWIWETVEPAARRLQEKWEAPGQREGAEAAEPGLSRSEYADLRYGAEYQAAIDEGVSEAEAVQRAMQARRVARTEDMPEELQQLDALELWTELEKKPGLWGEIGRRVGQVGGVGLSGVFEEPARAAVGGVGAGLLEGRYGEQARELSVEELAPVARVWPSLGWYDLSRIGALMESWKADPDNARSAIEEAMDRIKAGEDPEAVAAEHYNLWAQMVAEMALDPLNMIDLMGWETDIRRARQLSEAERTVATALDEVPEMRAAVEETRRALQEAGEAGAEAVAAGARAVGEGDRQGWVQRVGDFLKKPVELVPEAKAERDMGQVWIVLGGPLGDASSGDEALELMRRWVAEPESLRGRYGATVDSVAGQKAREVFGAILDEAAKLPEARKPAGAFNPAQFVVELEDLAMRTLREGYGWKEPGRYLQFANAWKGLQSEFYLTALMSPGYAARNTASDLFTMAADGLATFEAAEDIERYLGDLGGVTTRRVATGGRGAREALTGIREGESRLPGPLGWLSRKGQEITRYGEPFGRLPIGEEPRYQRAFYRGVKRWLDANVLRRTPDLAPDLRVMVGQAAEDLVEAVARETSPAAKRAAAERVLGARGPAQGIEPSRYLDLETMDAMSPEMYRRVRDRLAQLPADAGPEQVRAVMGEARGWVDEFEAEALRDWEPVTGRRVATDVEEAEVAEAVLVELRGALQRAGVPADEVERMVGQVEQRMAVLETALDEARANALANADYLIEGGQVQGSDALEVMLAANRDVDRMRDAVRRDLGDVMRQARDAYRQDPGRGREIWPAYFEQVAQGWEAAAQQRIGRYVDAGQQLDRLASGAPLEQVLGMSRREMAEARLRSAVVPEELELPLKGGKVFEPGSVLDAEDTAKFDQYLEARRRQVDVAADLAWRRGFGAPAERFGDVLDLLDSSARDVEFYGRKAAGEVAIARQTMLDEIDVLQARKPKRWKAKIKAAAERYYGERNRIWNDFFKQARDRWVQAEVDVGRVEAVPAAGVAGAGVPVARTRPGEQVARRTPEGMRSGVMNPEGTAEVRYRAPREEGGRWEVDYIGGDGRVIETRGAETEREAQRMAEMGEREANLRARAVPSGEQSVVGLHSVPEGAVVAKVRKEGPNWIVDYSDATGRVLESYDFGTKYPAAKAARNRAETIIAQRARAGSPLARAGAEAEEAPDWVRWMRGEGAAGEISPGYSREQWGKDLREVWGLPEEEARAMEAVMDARANVWARQTGRDASEYYGARFAGVVRGGEPGVGALSQEGAGWWYRAEEVVDAKMPARASVEQVRSILTKGGIKKDELEWSGVLRWLDEQKGPLTREDVLGYLQENRVEVQEVVRGSAEPPESMREALRQAREGEAIAADELAHALEREGMTADEAYGIVNYLRMRGGGADLVYAERVAPDELSRWEDFRDAYEAKQNELASWRGGTRYEQYTEAGGENYRELLLTLPESGLPEGWRRNERGYLLDETGQIASTSRSNLYRSPHWEEPNVLAHVRFDERVGPNGERVLFIEEIQSDWHQAGREKGYRGAEAGIDLSGYTVGESGGRWPAWELLDPEGQRVYYVDKDVVPDLDEARGILLREYRQVLEESGAARERGRVPAAPFAKSWDELALKRMMRWAAENDFDAIAWTTGAQQAARYDLAKFVDELHFTETGDLRAYRDGEEVFTRFVGTDGRDLAEHVGKEAARKLMDAPYDPDVGARVLVGEELSVGGHGMAGFYDRILPYSSNKLTKRWGVKVERGTVGAPGLRIMGTAEQDALAGLEAARFAAKDLPYTVVRADDPLQVMDRFASLEEAEKYIARQADMLGMDAWQLRLTPEMKADLLGEGLPMFQGRKAAAEFMDDGRAILRALEGADVSSVVHEVGHVWRRELTELAATDARAAADVRIMEDWAGVVEGKWTKAAEEKWARGVERYFAEGVAPSEELRGVFDRFKEWLVGIYRAIAGSEIDVELTDEVRGVMDRLLAEVSPAGAGDLAEAGASAVPLAGERVLTREGRRMMVPETAVEVRERLVGGGSYLDYRDQYGQVVKSDRYFGGEDAAAMRAQLERAEDVFARRKAGEAIGELEGLPEEAWRVEETGDERRARLASEEAEAARLAAEEGVAAERAQRVPGDVAEAARQRGYNPDTMTEEEWFRLAVDLRGEAGHAERRSTAAGLDALAARAAYTGRKEYMEIGGYTREVRARALTRRQERAYRRSLMGPLADDPKLYYRRQGALVDWYYDLADDAELMAGGAPVPPARVLPEELLITSSGVEDAERVLQQAMGDLEQARAAVVETEGRIGAGAGEFSRTEVTRRRRAATKAEKDLEDLVQRIRGEARAEDVYVQAAVEDAERVIGRPVGAAVEAGEEVPGWVAWMRQGEGRQAYNEAVVERGAGEAPARAEMVRVTAEATRRGLEQMEAGLLRDWDAWRPVVEDAAMRRGVEEWLEGEVMPRWYETRATALAYAKAQADFALLNYRNRRAFDVWLSYIAPYSYWYTRSGWNWAQRLAGRPGMLSQYLRARRAMKLANENAGRRARFEGKVGIPFPWLPEWMGDTVYVDPLRMVLPFAAFEMTDWDDPEEARRGLRAVYGGLEKVGLRPYHFLELPYQAGWLARAGEAMGMAPEQAQEYLGPEQVGDFGFFLPQTRALRSASALGRELAPGAFGWVPPGGINVEAPLRRGLGLPAGEVWDPYRVGRSLANMAGERAEDYGYARAAMMAQELVRRDETQTGRVWAEGSELAQQVAAELGWSPEELARAQELVAEAMQRTALEQGVGSVGWALGPSMSVEPVGERRRLELAEGAGGMGWSPENLAGSREAYEGYREQYPALEAHYSQYGLVPGEDAGAGAGYTPGMRLTNLEISRRRDEINAEYDRRVDELLRMNPADREGRQALEDERQEALAAVGDWMSTAGAEEPEGALPRTLYGENPAEYAERVAMDEARRVRDSAPSPEDFTDSAGEIDWSGYYAEYDRWMAGLPGSTAALEAVQAMGGRYAGLGLAELVEAYGQRYDSPLEAVAQVYRDVVVDGAWDEYRRMVDAGVRKGEAYDRTVGAIGVVPAVDLIPDVLRVYRSQGWTREQLAREYAGVRFPAYSVEADASTSGDASTAGGQAVGAAVQAAGQAGSTYGGGGSTGSGWMWPGSAGYDEAADRVRREGWRSVYGEPWWEKYGLVGRSGSWGQRGSGASAGSGRWTPAGASYEGRWRPPSRVYGGPFRS